MYCGIWVITKNSYETNVPKQKTAILSILSSITIDCRCEQDGLESAPSWNFDGFRTLIAAAAALGRSGLALDSEISNQR